MPVIGFLAKGLTGGTKKPLEVVAVTGIFKVICLVNHLQVEFRVSKERFGYHFGKGLFKELELRQNSDK